MREIRLILDQPDFDVQSALKAHRQGLKERVARLNGLMETIDKTMAHMRGERSMSTGELFEGFDEETQKRYEEEASRLWGEKHVKESRRRWDSYSKEKRAAILARAVRSTGADHSPWRRPCERARPGRRGALASEPALLL